MVEDTYARGHRMPSRINQNRPWTRWNNSPRQLDYTLCQVCQHRRPETLIIADACHTVCEYCGQKHDNREVHTGSCVGECFYCGVSGTHTKFTSRRDYQEAMAPRGTSAHTSDSERDNQTCPPVLRLRGTGKPGLGESDCRSENNTSDLADGNSESSVDESST
jgi:hypothetical protein